MLASASPVTPRPTILVVDDTPENLELLHHTLADRYRVRMAASGSRALELAEHSQPDLVLLDVAMPDMDGYEVCRELKSRPRLAGVPVIFVTANAADNNEHLGLSCGAVDYVAKPFNPALLLARIDNHLALKASSDRLRAHGEALELEVRRRTEALSLAHDATILAMASLAEARDNETGNHIRRTQRYVRALAETLAQQTKYADLLTPTYICLLYKSAPLHDIGKIGIPDSILRKPGPLDTGEMKIMRSHAEIGRRAIEKAETELGTPIEFLRVAKEIAYGHHEKWDGSGYPQGLVGEAIPLSARLMALADVYDALVSRRVYKALMTHGDAASLIRAGSGTHFDPSVVAAFDASEAEFERISRELADPEMPDGDPVQETHHGHH